MRTIFIFCVILFAPSMFFGQSETKQAQWTKIKSPKGDMSFAVPPYFLIDNEEEQYKAIAFQGEIIMRVGIQENGNAKSRLTRQSQFPSNNEGKVTRFEVGDFIGDVYKYENEKGFTTTIYAASSKAVYTISASSKDSKSSVLEKFFSSIKLDNQTLFKQEPKPNQTEEEVIISIASLKTSPIILEALNRKDTAKPKIIYEIGKKETPVDITKYSRPLITLRQPRADYTNGARQAGIQGNIRLKVLFQNNGEVGEITVLSELKKGLTENAVDAARRIKFLPAEIDGKAVSITRVVEYSFTVY